MKCKLIWNGYLSSKTKLLLEDGRNLFDLLPVQAIQFTASNDSEELMICASPVSEAEVDGLLVLPEEILAKIAEGMGFNLVRKVAARYQGS